MNYDISNKDKSDWENFLSKDEKLLDKDAIIKNKKKNKIQTIDLHGYTLDQANIKVESFIIKAFEEKISKLIIVTGKGLHSQNEKDPYVSKDYGILKHSVPNFINNNKKLKEIIYKIQDAKNEDGGSGAFYVYLKKKL